MEEKNNREQLQGLSGQLMELFVANVLTKNSINVQEVKQRITEEQRNHLKKTVEQLQTQVNAFLETKEVPKTTEANEETKEQALNPLREAFNQRKKKENE